MKKADQTLMEIYEQMLSHFGPRGWWPGKTDFEICVGAILTQSVSWANVEKAIRNLEALDLLDPYRLDEADDATIEAAIRSTLYFRQKTKKLKAFCRVLLDEYQGSLDRLFDQETPGLRKRLLLVKGIGKETADSIILYAARQPIFVVDAYTSRVFSRLGIFKEDITYDEMQAFFHRRLPADQALYNEYHALIVGIGNRFCANTKPRCGDCPLNQRCKYPARDAQSPSQRIGKP